MPKDTPLAILEKIPAEVKDLVNRVYQDIDVLRNSPEVKDLLPSQSLIAVINNPPASVGSDLLDQAESWITEQYEWQTRAIKVQAKLQELAPFTAEQAKAGELPLWMSKSWATKLLYDWSEGLRSAVLEAEEYASTHE
jgi:hypothetical protein